MFVASTPFERPLPTELGHRGNWICMNLLQQSRIDLQKKISCILNRIWVTYHEVLPMFDSGIHAWPLQYADSDVSMPNIGRVAWWTSETMILWPVLVKDLYLCFHGWADRVSCKDFIFLRKCLVLCVCLLLSPACMTWWGVTGRERFTSEDSFDSLKIM